MGVDGELGNVPAYVQVREVRRRARLLERWATRGPSAYERWAYRAPWHAAAVLALLAGYAAGRNYRRWVEPSVGPAGETPWAVGSTLVLVVIVVAALARQRETAALYAEWSGQPASEPGTSRWLIVVAVGVAAAVLPTIVRLPAAPAPPPDGAAIGRAVAGATGEFEVLGGDVEAVTSRELSLVEEGLERWFVATRDAHGSCVGLVFVGGAHERTEPLAVPCTGSRARQRLG